MAAPDLVRGDECLGAAGGQAAEFARRHARQVAGKARSSDGLVGFAANPPAALAASLRAKALP